MFISISLWPLIINLILRNSFLLPLPSILSFLLHLLFLNLTIVLSLRFQIEKFIKPDRVLKLLNNYNFSIVFFLQVVLSLFFEYLSFYHLEPHLFCLLDLLLEVISIAFLPGFSSFVDILFFLWLFLIHLVWSLFVRFASFLCVFLGGVLVYLFFLLIVVIVFLSSFMGMFSLVSVMVICLWYFRLRFLFLFWRIKRMELSLLFLLFAFTSRNMVSKIPHDNILLTLLILEQR